MTEFGTIVTGADVAAAVEAHVRTWSPTYLAELERRTGRDAAVLPGFRSYVRAEDNEWETADQLPGCLIVIPGLAAPPERHGDGTYTASWIVHVAAVVSANTRHATDDLKKVYAAAIRSLFIQHPSVGGFASETTWDDERYDDIPFTDQQTISVGVVSFTISVEGVVSAYEGPTVVPVDPYAEPLPSTRVETVFVSTERKR